MYVCFERERWQSRFALILLLNSWTRVIIKTNMNEINLATPGWRDSTDVKFTITSLIYNFGMLYTMQWYKCFVLNNILAQRRCKGKYMKGTNTWKVQHLAFWFVLWNPNLVLLEMSDYAKHGWNCPVELTTRVERIIQTSSSTTYLHPLNQPHSLSLSLSHFFLSIHLSIYLISLSCCYHGCFNSFNASRQSLLSFFC